MDVRLPLSRRRFFGGVATAMGVLGLRPTSGLFAQGQTAQFGGGEAEYDAFAKLASNENNFGPPENVMEAMNHAWKYANRYGYPDGNVIQEIAAHHGVKPENVLLTPGSGEVLEVVGEAFLMGGKKVVGADPTYATVYQHATEIKAEGIKVPLLKNYQQDLDTMISEANKNAATVGLFYLCNPNNPTGMVISAADVKKVVEGIPEDDADPHRRGLPPLRRRPGLRHLDPVRDRRPAGDRRPHLLEDRGAGGDARRLRHLHARDHQAAAASTPRTASTCWPSTAPWRRSRTRAGQAEVKTKIIALRNKTTRELEAHGYPVIPSQTNFFMVSLGDGTVQPTIEAFKQKGVLVGRPFPPMLNHLRVSVGLPEEMDKFTKTFKEIFPKKAAVSTMAARG